MRRGEGGVCSRLLEGCLQTDAAVHRRSLDPLRCSRGSGSQDLGGFTSPPAVTARSGGPHDDNCLCSCKPSTLCTTLTVPLS